jgi:hypothetical protein
MSPGDDLEREIVGQLGTNVPLACCRIGECRVDVELRGRARRALEARDLYPDRAAQRLEELALARLDPLGRRQHTLLVLLESRRDVTLPVGERLPALVVSRYEVAVGVADLDVVAEDAVEADLERLDPGALALLPLDVRDRVPASIAQRS